MKTVKCFLLVVLLSTLNYSCSNDDTLPNNDESIITNDDPRNQVACEFDFSTFSSNDEILINCNYNLNGQTITLPENITLKYDGGILTNGTIILDGGQIDGKLLNADLEIEGSSRLLSTDFVFEKEKWNITEGQVSDNVAIINKDNINKAINQVKQLRGYTFDLNNIDAYFNVSHTNDRHDLEATILIPSNFHFKMGDDCNLRVQPNGELGSVLMYSKSTENVLISGGKLWGDRYTHDYNSISGTHEWGHIIMFRGVHNSTIDGVEMHEAAGDGFEIGGTAHRNNDGSLKSHGRESYNVTVKNCLLNDHRRNNMSIVDGTDLFIEYNTFLNAGSGNSQPGVSSNGISPRAGIDIEAFKNNAPDNNSVYHWELCTNIHIRNNTFENSFSVDVAIYNGETTSVYENTFKSKRAVSSAYSFNNKVYNNSFERPEGLRAGSQAINLEPRYWANGEHRVKDFEVYGNTFSGYQFAIVAGGQGHTIKNNLINDCQRGIIVITSLDIEFDNNIINSSVNNSYGYYTFSSETVLKNILIKNGETNVQGLGLYISFKNNNDEGDITIDNVDFNGNIGLNTAQNITVKNSTFNNIGITNCSPVLINNN
jgi:hypothetical protein